MLQIILEAASQRGVVRVVALVAFERGTRAVERAPNERAASRFFSK